MSITQKYRFFFFTYATNVDNTYRETKFPCPFRKIHYRKLRILLKYQLKHPQLLI